MNVQRDKVINPFLDKCTLPFHRRDTCLHVVDYSPHQTVCRQMVNTLEFTPLHLLNQGVNYFGEQGLSLQFNQRYRPPSPSQYCRVRKTFYFTLTIHYKYIKQSDLSVNAASAVKIKQHRNVQLQIDYYHIFIAYINVLQNRYTF